jgi:hypothetical protein
MIIVIHVNIKNALIAIVDFDRDQKKNWQYTFDRLERECDKRTFISYLVAFPGEKIKKRKRETNTSGCDGESVRAVFFSLFILTS